ncbi:sugar porter family MFS transporter [Sphingomonas sp. R-74633]|uniref:sugar porter family MFS transporter n=1 Tax=Sphingomonas sp. R-74633 TaxID=2751188 RepID=UPI0015D34B98|nr:sugar porter family MFS transporter [Sphingomonas sp. R-74633]NYT41474.1 sugar porter family MFS transporter [Sphingomonas sp. R-74633]
MTGTLWRGVIVGALAGLLFGFDTAVIAGTTEGLRRAFDLDATGLGITVSSALWGTLLGAIFAGRPGDRYGARACLRWVAGLYLLSGLGCFLAPSWETLIAFRFLAGIAVGASSVLAPVYLSEIAPPARRGALVGAFQFNIVFGILVAYLSNYLVGTMALGDFDWRVKFGITALPAALLLTLLYAIPQSPRWLALKGRRTEALQVMEAIGVADPQAEIDALAAMGESGNARLSWSRHKRPILLAVTVAMFNQLSGINAILYYLNDIFAAAGFDGVSADKQAIAIGAMNLLFTGLALAVIDKLGRRTLLLIGAVGLTATLAGVAAIMATGQHRELLLYLLAGFIAFFAFSQGAVIWVYIAEVFPTEVRARGQALGSGTHWLMDAIIATGFPVIAAHSAGAPFAFFAAMMALQFVVVAFFFPETKRLPLDRKIPE